MGNVGHKIMVFDDLNELKFRNVNKTLGLDIDHMKIVLSTLAKWHAATSILLMKVCFILISSISNLHSL